MTIQQQWKRKQASHKQAKFQEATEQGILVIQSAMRGHFTRKKLLSSPPAPHTSEDILAGSDSESSFEISLAAERIQAVLRGHVARQMALHDLTRCVHIMYHSVTCIAYPTDLCSFREICDRLHVLQYYSRKPDHFLRSAGCTASPGVLLMQYIQRCGGSGLVYETTTIPHHKVQGFTSVYYYSQLMQILVNKDLKKFACMNLSKYFCSITLYTCTSA